MMKLSRVLLVFALVLALCPAAFAVEYWVVREKSGKCVVVKIKPTDASLIFKGPFHNRKEAKVVVKECAPRGRAAAVEYWVIREPSGVLVIVQEKPSDPAVIVKGPFRERKQAEVVIKKSPRGGAVAPQRRPAEAPKVVPDRTKPSERLAPDAAKPTEGVKPPAPAGERPGVTKPSEKSAPGAAKPSEGVKSPPPSGESPGVTKPSEKPMPGGGEKPGASGKEEKPQQPKE
jgi:hypothetical protein